MDDPLSIEGYAINEEEPQLWRNHLKGVHSSAAILLTTAEIKAMSVWLTVCTLKSTARVPGDF